MFGKIKVKSYSIDLHPRNILGQGAFGTVYKGRDYKQNAIAAKQIDGNKHPKVLTQDLDILMKLDHPNVMRILDVEKTEKIVWMMMPFCDLGDLNEFYKTRDVSHETSVNIMKEIAAGIKYLHKQDIIHRDIKPGNILVFSATPLQLKLADFDVYKCLDPEVETSLMSSNVGTLAFKALEFFQRTSPGKIEYHRNVDIYAAGLTFLAIIQAEKGKKMLIPRIETPIHDSEFYAPSIGQLIAERIKYKVAELNIVHVEKATWIDQIEDTKRNLRWLISQMTCINPKERLSAGQVLSELETVEAYLKWKIYLGREETFKLEGLLKAVTDDKDKILTRANSHFGFHITVLNRLSGEVRNTITSECNHTFACLLAHPTEADFVLEGCPKCKMIRNYDVNTGHCTVSHRQDRFNSMCVGPAGSILVLSHFPGYVIVGVHGIMNEYYPCHGENKLSNPSHTKLSILKWEKEQQQFEIDMSLTFGGKLIQKCYYVERPNMLVVMCENKEIEAVKFGSKSIIWTLSRVVDGHEVKPVALTSDKWGNVYVSDGENKRILKLYGSGNVLNIFLLEGKDLSLMRSLFWSDTAPNLTLIHENSFSIYNIPNLD